MSKVFEEFNISEKDYVYAMIKQTDIVNQNKTLGKRLNKNPLSYFERKLLIEHGDKKVRSFFFLVVVQSVIIIMIKY